MKIEYPKPKLAICTPIPVVRIPDGRVRLSTVTYEWHRARMSLRMPIAYDNAEIGITGLEVGDARNLAVKYAKEKGCEWLFFLDYDVLPAPNCLQQLMYRATQTHKGFDIYSGIYCIKEHPSIPIVYKGWNNGPYFDWDFGDVLTDGIVASGMGCALLNLSLFDRLPHSDETPWFKTHQLECGSTVTEDCWFTNRLVNEIEGKILVDCSNLCICGHIDNSTGEIFTLEPDCPPVVRAGIKV